MAGSNTVPAGKGQPGVYGTEYQFAPSNSPGARNSGALSWTDQSGKLWLFGGFGYDSSGTAGYLGDLWVFDPSVGANGEWAWMGGSSTLSTNSVGYTGQPGVYGLEYQFAPSNVPGGRQSAISWTDASGRFWLFGGEGFDSAGNAGYLSDLWVFDPSQGTYGEWAWMGGNSTVSSVGFGCDQPTHYGTEYQFADSNYPGHRAGSLTWTDQSGRLWLFGGGGCDYTDYPADMNDLWVFDPFQGAHGEWAWMGGSEVSRANGTYGAEYQFARTNAPGARDSAAAWTDTSGRLWLFGGEGYDSLGNYSSLNDLWVFDPSQGAHGEWAWMGGSNTVRAPGAYGTEYRFADSNVPGSRDGAMSWTDKNGRLWLFGGLGYDSLGHYGYLNDLWVFDIAPGTHGQWAWTGGSSTLPSGYGDSGVYGTEYQYAPSNVPGARNTGATWVDLDGKLWLFGGEGFDSLGNNGLLNDLWELEVPNFVVTPGITWPAPAAIIYGTALSDAQLDATANVPGTFTYSPAAGTVLNVGTQTPSVTFTPADTTDYTTATATVQLTVNQATPTLSWPAPTAIAYGTALSATQLDATANVQGTFTYSPAAGTVLIPGTQTLAVTFTPTDTTDYTTATATVQLTVNLIGPIFKLPIDYPTATSSTQHGATANVSGTSTSNPAAGDHAVHAHGHAADDPHTRR
ncbi:MAG TPA: kelch repeat-containing protein [Terracidiphilus sp.]|nr:kelch repeat-containing protein [Terracidiphilus sp.]